MLAWIVPSCIALAALGWAMYERYRPRAIAKVKYRVSDTEEKNEITFAAMFQGTDGESKYYESRKDLIGKIVEVRSFGNIAAESVLVHLAFIEPFYAKKIETDERYEVYGSESEINVKIERLNPQDVVRVIALFYKDIGSITPSTLIHDLRITCANGKSIAETA